MRGKAIWIGLLGAVLAGAACADTAQLAVPTDRYEHDVLGGIPPFTTLQVTRAGKTIAAVLPETLVFEDIAPRLWDVTGDGAPEIVVVESHVAKGARLTVWTVQDNTLTRLATTPFIDQPRRWLAPAAAADFDGDGTIEIAYVDRPHLNQELVFVQIQGKRLVETARLPGLTNHRIGDSEITAVLRDCGGPEVLLPSADWTRLMAATPKGARDLGPFSPAAMTAAQACQ